MSGATLPTTGVDIEVSLAIGRKQAGAVWDSGTWDFNTWQEADTPLGDWTDVTCDVAEGLGLGAGSSADGVVTRWEAQTCAFALLGETYDPRSGPYAGLLGPNLPVRLRWRPTGTDDTAWLTAFVGQTNDDGFAYDPKNSQAHIAATDGTAIFQAFDGVEQPSQGSQETAAQRVTRIADMVSWPAGLRDITAGGVSLQATTLAETAWTMLLAVADTDLALMWLNRAGQLAYRPEGKVTPSHQLEAIIGCDITDPPVGVTVIDPINILGQQPSVTRNIVSISRQARDSNDTPATVTMRDEASVSRFLAHQYQRTDLVHYDDSWTATVAQAILMGSAWPSSSPASVELSSRVDRASSVLLLSMEPSLSVQVTDGISAWECEPSGWQVTINHRSIEGAIDLLDVSQWYGGSWDDTTEGQGWDLAMWGF